MHLCGEEEQENRARWGEVSVFEDPGTQRKEENNRRLGRRTLQMGRRVGAELNALYDCRS